VRKRRLLILSVLLIGAVVLTPALHGGMGTETVFTHLFYIPIGLAAIWFRRWGIVIATALGAYVVGSHCLLRPGEPIVADLLRAAALIAISVIGATLSQQLSQRQAALFQYQQRLRDASTELSLTEERQRQQLAAQLHDGLVQDLVALRLQVGHLASQEGGSITPEILADIHDLVDHTTRDARSLTYGLCPPVLYQSGLEAATEWLADEFEQRHGVTCKLVTQGEPIQLDSDGKSLLFQTARELLANVAKHADARHVEIRIRSGVDHMCLEVRDDGKGFDPEEILVRPGLQDGFGLFSIQERLRHMEGHLEIDSAPGRGSRLRACVPLKPFSQDSEA
jgi:signal transduction histidine kinase